MTNDATEQPVYRLGDGCPTRADGTPLYSWPLRVDYAPGHPSGDFYLAEGDARNGNGGFFRAADVLQEHWRGHLETTGTLWLVPLLERMARGEAVAPAEVLGAYARVHGAPPPLKGRAVP